MDHWRVLFRSQVLDVFEDLDGDGTEDRLDEDEDGDGFSNIIERPIPRIRGTQFRGQLHPFLLHLQKGTPFTKIPPMPPSSQLTAIDPDSNDTLSYSMVMGWRCQQ